MEYEIKGSGEKTIVFLHGWGQDKTSLQPISSYLEKEYRCIYLTFPKMSKSKIGRPYSIFCYASDVFSLLKRMNIRHVSLVGHSFGGRVAILLASLFDLQVDKMVLIDSAGLKEKWSISKWIKVKYYKVLKLLSKFHLYSKEKLNKHGSADYRALNEFEKYSFQKVIHCYLEQYLSHISCATLMIWGTKDKITPYYFAKRLQRGIKDSAIIALKDCGHFSYLEKRGEVSIILKSFFEVHA